MDRRIPTKRSAAIPILISVHLVVVLVAAQFASNQPAVSSAVFISLVFSQASLIGMWGGFGNTHWMLRLIGVAAGTLLLTVVFNVGAETDPVFLLFLLVLIATSVVTAVTWGVRILKARLERVGQGDPIPREGLQFTIRHLLLLTFAVACLVTVGKALAPHLGGIVFVPVQIIVLGLCFVAVALAAVWAMLGSGRPALRVVPVLLVAAASGWTAGLTMGHSRLVFWVSLTVLEALYLVASLCVVRFSGYRLVANR